MTQPSLRKRIWGWFFFDWASQPYNTLLITFIFGPYINELIGDGAKAQEVWGFGIGAAGFVIAILAPILGALSDISGSRMRWIWFFSLLYFGGPMACGGRCRVTLTCILSYFPLPLA